MGKVEKVVVLSVLFLVTLILVVALGTTESPGGESGDPLVEDLEAFDRRFPVEDPIASSGDEASVESSPPTAVVAEPEPAPSEPVAAATAPASRQPDVLDPGVLDEVHALEALLANEEPPAERRLAAVDPPKEPPRKEPERGTSALLSSNVATTRVPAGAVLVTLDGLEKTLDPELMHYTWKSGDSLRDVALRYFGDARRTDLILKANEGSQSFLTAEKIWIPVYELDGRVTPPEARKDVEMRTHVVQDGDSLWTISKQYYGKGGLWKRIYEANRDVMANENALTVGVKLRIPPER